MPWALQYLKKARLALILFSSVINGELRHRRVKWLTRRCSLKRGPNAVHTCPVFGWYLKFSLLILEMASSKPQTPKSKPDDTAQTTAFCSSQLRDWSEEGFWVSSLLNWERSCVNWHHCRSGKAQKILMARTWTSEKQPHSSQKMNPQSRSCHSRRNMCHGNSRGKMCHGKILMDSAQDEDMQIETKLNAIEQDNTYPSKEENSQHTRKKDGV